jgi:hypothetical protein
MWNNMWFGFTVNDKWVEERGKHVLETGQKCNAYVDSDFYLKFQRLACVSFSFIWTMPLRIKGLEVSSKYS